MKNSLIACGGTGAHVALAMLRFHTLGYALGFFRRGDKSLELPTLYLVDQDYGDGATATEPTAWQEVRRLAQSHPGRYNWEDSLKIVTPLPVGRDNKWFGPPNDTLGVRFKDSPYLRLLTSRDQQGIRYSHGMMGSPAIGSLLFRLKQFDTRPEGGNKDAAFNTLLKEHGRVAVVGSAVGGTGASVAPTLARMLAEKGAHVMAVMVLDWFKFKTEGVADETAARAQRRNMSMTENANSAFAYYGRSLASDVATVPVGIPSRMVDSRQFTSDTQQPIFEAYVHGVAALCCLHQYLKPSPPGLYQMGTEDPVCLGGGNSLPGGGSIQSLANQAATLADMLDAFAHVLFVSHSRGLLSIEPAIYKHIRKFAEPKEVGQVARALAKEYREHITWLRDTLGVDPHPNRNLLLERHSRKRLAEKEQPSG